MSELMWKRQVSFRAFLLAASLLLLSATACASQATAEPSASAVPSAPPATPTSSMGCSVIDAKPTPVVSEPLATISAKDFARGPQAAPVTLLAYCDFQSAQCEVFNRALDQLEKNHPNDLRVVIRPFPIPSSVVPSLDKSGISAQAAIAAGDQGKFWEMRDRLHAQFGTWTAFSGTAFQKWAADQAQELGLDRAAFEKDLVSPETVARAQAMYAEATRNGIAAIPTVFINGNLQQRAGMSYDGLDSTIGLISLGARQFKTCPPFEIDPGKQYTATVRTEKGDIVIQLFADKAPLAVNSFVFLARQGWYDGVTFHRVIPGYIAQAGDPSGTGSGGPGYYFNNEVLANVGFDKPGMVGMANAGPDTNGSQFFITYTPQPKLDGSYTVFGQVVSGMDVVESLTARDPQQSSGLPPGDKILTVSIQER